MKKLLALLICLMLPFSLALAEDSAPQGLSYKAEEFNMPAIGFRVYIPADMEGYGGDEEAFDMGFRFNLGDEAIGFSMDGSVECGRDMSLADYANFFGERAGYGEPKVEEINGCMAVTLTKTEDPAVTVVVLGGKADLQKDDPYYYELLFYCGSEKADALKAEILSTITEND